MSKANVDRGKRFELASANHATDRFIAAGIDYEVSRRAALGLPQDEGDLFGIPDVTIQCKDASKIDLAGFVASAEKQGEAADTSQRIALVKRRMKPVGESYVVQTYDRWLDVQIELARLRTLAGLDSEGEWPDG